MQRARNERAVGDCLMEVIARKRRLLKLVRALVLARVLTSLSLRYQPVATDLERAVSMQKSPKLASNTGHLRTVAGYSIGEEAKETTANHVSTEVDEWPVLIYGCCFFCLLLVLVIPFCH